MNILGISAFYHDSAAALVRDGLVVAAAQEERFTRKKHDQSFPAQAAAFCLEQAGISASQLDYVAFYDKPLLKFERLLQTYLAYAPRGFTSFRAAMPVWLKEKLWTRDTLREKLGYDGDVLFTEHHESHAASAFFPSPFEEAAVLTMDGVGEWATASVGVGRGGKLALEAELHFPHSLGLLYSAFTYYTGFKVNSGEYKVMGLAPYGKPVYLQAILETLMDLKPDGSFRLDMRYFDYCAGLTMTNERFHALFGGPPRAPESKLTQRDMDLAASIQAAAEEVMLRMARHARERTGSRNLCLAGGVALNCVGNGKIVESKIFDDVWIQPAAGDAGGALGAALFTWYDYLDNPRRVDGRSDSQRGSLLGPSYSDARIEACLRAVGAPYERLDEKALAERVARRLADGKIVGFFQGRMEYGPRALGARSILGDPRDPGMQSQMNLKIKFRESFRPFAPAVARESAADWFELDRDSPYMMLVAPVKAERKLPAVTHVDGSARIQTVAREPLPVYYETLKAFERLTGCPVLINTSFNVRGEPIVCTPEQAYACFMRTDIDALAIGSFMLEKQGQPKLAEEGDWRKEFVLD